MQMIHALTGIATGVGHNAITFSVQPLLACHGGSKGQQAAEQALAIVARGVAHRRNVPGRDHEHVDRRLWVYVPEGEGVNRAFHDFRGDLTRYDLTEETVSHDSLAA